MNKNRLSRFSRPALHGVIQPQMALLLGMNINARELRAGPMTIFLEHTADMGWHMVLVHPSRMPDLDEVMAYRLYLLPPQILAAVILPASERDFLIGQRVDVWEIVRAEQMLAEKLGEASPSTAPQSEEVSDVG